MMMFFPIHAQSQKQWVKQGDKSFKERDFYGASLYYRRAMVLDSGNLEVVYKYADALRLYNEYELGEKYFQYVYKKDLGKNFKEALFWLASMQKYNAKYQDARKNFTKFTGIYKNKDSFFYKKAKQEIGSCEFAQNLMQDTLPLLVSNLGPSVNTTNAEFSPLIINDTTLYFSSLRSDKIKEKTNEVNDPAYHIKIYSASKKDSGWVTQKELSQQVNSTKFHDANGTFSADKKHFYFTRCDEEFKCGIYISDIIGDEWTEPRLAEGEINVTGFTSTQPFITSVDNKEILFFSSDRPGGEGGYDVWWANLESEKVDKIYNAGKKVNSIDDELSPFFDAKASILYFSSGWHYGLGGYDIFKSSGKPGFFEGPVNLGYPINTSVNDFYYTFFDHTGNGFLTSNRKGSITAKGETCCNDIWFFETKKEPKSDSIVPLVTIKETEKYIPVKLYFHNDEPDPRSTDTLTLSDYKETYEKYLKKEDEYKKAFSAGLSPSGKKIAEDSIDHFFTNYIEAGGNNLEKFTEQLLTNLNKGQRLEVTVKGFASPLAKTDYNVNLTLRRISSMENYMKKYKNGALLPYFKDSAANKGYVAIIRIPFGEYKALGHVNDNLKEKRNSVYSPEAALERKIEIVSVTHAHQDSLTPKMKFYREIFNFGSVNAGDTLSHIFKFKNTGNQPLVIHEIKPTCDCLIASFDSAAVNPGQTGIVKIQLLTADLRGKQVHHVEILTNQLAVTKELTVTAEIFREK